MHRGVTESDHGQHTDDEFDPETVKTMLKTAYDMHVEKAQALKQQLVESGFDDSFATPKGQIKRSGSSAGTPSAVSPPTCAGPNGAPTSPPTLAGPKGAPEVHGPKGAPEVHGPGGAPGVAAPTAAQATGSKAAAPNCSSSETGTPNKRGGFIKKLAFEDCCSYHNDGWGQDNF